MTLFALPWRENTLWTYYLAINLLWPGLTHSFSPVVVFFFPKPCNCCLFYCTMLFPVVQIWLYLGIFYCIYSAAQMDFTASLLPAPAPCVQQVVNVTMGPVLSHLKTVMQAHTAQEVKQFVQIAPQVWICLFHTLLFSQIDKFQIQCYCDR